MSGTPETPQPEAEAPAPREAPVAEAETDETPAPAPPKPKSRVWAQVLLGIAILVCGMLIGAGATVLVVRHIIRPDARQPAQVSGAIARQMSRRLNLTPQQERDVRRIIREHMEGVNEIRNEARQEARQELDSMREEVARALTPQQARAWRREFDRMRRLAPQPPGGRWERGGARGGPPGHGPDPKGGPHERPPGAL